MLGTLSRGLPLLVAFGISMLTTANGATIAPFDIHREAVDETSYPWSAVGKLFNETGGSCSGVVISRQYVLTAAHCVYNYRTHRFIPAEALHFLVGYHTGRYSAHVRIARYRIGPGFDPLSYEQTSNADWAVLAVTEALPADIEPLRLSHDAALGGTKATLVGYPQDRAFAMTADRDCELREKMGTGRLLLHTCRGVKGYSGAPILVSAGNHEVQIAGIQIATIHGDGAETMIAVPAQAILSEASDDGAAASIVVSNVSDDVCRDGAGDMELQHIRARLELGPSDAEQPEIEQAEAEQPDIVSSIPHPNDAPVTDAMTWLALDPFAVALP